MNKKIFYTGLAVILTTLSAFTSFASTEEDVDTVSSEILDPDAAVLTVTDVDTENTLDDEQELSEDVASEEDYTDVVEVDGEEDESVTETLDVMTEVDEDTAEDIRAFWNDPDLPDTIFVSVRWGFFDENVGLDSNTIDSDGIVHFDGSALGLPIRLVKWEHGTDRVVFGRLNKATTVWESLIAGYNDGLLFKIKSDLSATGDDEAIMHYTNDYIDDTIELSLNNLLDSDELIFVFSDNYWVVFNAWTKDEWVSEVANKFGVDTSVASDYVENAWYVKYMNLVVNKGYFSGYKDENGKNTGKIGPGDVVTRFQTLKIFYELADDLDLGIGTTTCDPSTVALSSQVDWMGAHWAAPYVQCIYNSGYDLTLMNDIIDDDLTEGIKAAKRWEVMVTAFEMMDLEVNEDAVSEFEDLEQSGLEEEYQDMINTSVEMGVLSGYPDGTFKPYNDVLRSEMFKIVALFEELLSV